MGIPDPAEITLENIDELIDYWSKECQDIDPRNCDSRDIPGVDIHDLVARKAICTMPVLLLRLKDHLVATDKIGDGS